MSEQASVSIERLSKRFGDVVAVDAVSLQVRPGEFFSLLGPSGCGKTTLLRMIAGLELPTDGLLLIDGMEMTHVPAHRRPVNMVFQHYALFPHLTVEQNVAFGLRYQNLDRAEHARLVAEALDLVQLANLGPRKPNQLSGGQRQRVALARALVLRPRVLLLDEPLGALDQKLRKEMQVELKNLQRELGMTFVFVTHDQEEALTMSDRIAVMNGGHIEQLDAAATVFERPRTAFVAEFMGAGNFFTGTVRAADARGLTVTCVAGFETTLMSAGRSLAVGQEVSFIVRPEKLTLHTRPPDSAGLKPPPMLKVLVEQRVYQGLGTVWTLRCTTGQKLTVYQQNHRPYIEEELQPEQPAYVSWDAGHAVLLDGAEASAGTKKEIRKADNEIARKESHSARRANGRKEFFEEPIAIIQPGFRYETGEEVEVGDVVEFTAKAGTPVAKYANNNSIVPAVVKWVHGPEKPVVLYGNETGIGLELAPDVGTMTEDARNLKLISRKREA